MVARGSVELYWPGLLAVAAETLQIYSFENTGLPLADTRTLRVSDVASALEQAYRMGLADGHCSTAGE